MISTDVFFFKTYKLGRWHSVVVRELIPGKIDTYRVEFQQGSKMKETVLPLVRTTSIFGNGGKEPSLYTPFYFEKNNTASLPMSGSTFLPGEYVQYTT